ncbi:MAG: hypothetical protein ACK5QT_01720 [Oligoflexia bacterium]|jgi:hypothetical protein
MSATRDPSEKVSFLFTPIRAPGNSAGLVRKIKNTPVIRPSLLRERERPVVREYRAPELTGALPAASAQALQNRAEGLSGLRKSLGELENIQKRFRFLLQELEDLIKD